MDRGSSDYLKDVVRTLVVGHGAKTLLDYRARLGRFAAIHPHTWGGLKPHVYDPSVTELSREPTTNFDGVVCIDAPTTCDDKIVESFLSDVLSYGEKFAVISIQARLSTWPENQRWWDRKVMEVLGYPHVEMATRHVCSWHTSIRSEGGPDVHLIFEGLLERSSEETYATLLEPTGRVQRRASTPKPRT